MVVAWLSRINLLRSGKAALYTMFMYNCLCYFRESTISLVDRQFLTLKDFTNDELKTFLWTASDLKQRLKYDQEVCK